VEIDAMIKNLLARFGIFTCTVEERQELDALHWLFENCATSRHAYAGSFPLPSRIDVESHRTFSINASFSDRVWLVIHYGKSSKIVAQGTGEFLKAYREARGHFEVFLATEKMLPR
jgi:hypothetical protein